MTTRSEQPPAPRMRPWPRPGRPSYAHLALGDHRQRPSAAQVERWVARLAADGYAGVRTGALEPVARAAFETAGFRVAQRLALLDLEGPYDVPRTRGPHLRAMRGARDLATAERIDLAAFDDDWGFDAAALEEALAATPSHRARLAIGPSGAAIGFAITGRAGRHGFLQRIAVDPAHHRQGAGAVLVADGLRWLRRWRVTSVLVNTEVANAAALGLYQRFGFRLRPEELVVMERAL